MIPSFALSLSFEGISLLQKAAGGWRLVGDVAVDSPDLTRDLAALRDKAAALADGELRCKVIIPNDQVRYVSVATGNFEGAAQKAMVRSALDGATPYPVEQLKFDTSLDGDTTHIAAVVNDTFAEAESFAIEHGFNPVCIVAAPGDSPFLGEPFFGPTAYAAGLADVDQVESDGIAVVVIGAVDDPVSDTVSDSEIDTVETPESVSESDPLLDLDSEPEPELISEPEARLTGFSSKRAGIISDDIPDPEPVVFKSAKAKAKADEDARLAEQPQPEPISVTAPTLDVPDSDQTNPDQTDPGQETAEPSGISGFLSRRNRAKRVEPALQATTTPATELASTAPRVSAPTAIPNSATGPTLTAVSRPTDSAFISANPSSPGAEEAARMTVFGARGQADVGGKPRHLGLMLSAALLLFLVAVAAWASVFLEDGVAGLFRSAPPRTELAAVPDTPAIGVKAEDPATPALPEDTASVPVASEPPPATSTELAALPPADIDIPSLPAPRRLTAPDQPSTPVSPTSPTLALPTLTDTDSAVLEALRTPVQDETQPALPGDEATIVEPVGEPALTAAFELLDTAPQVPRTPSIIGLGDLYVASIDRTDHSQDAIALPTVAMLDTDLPLGEVSSPVAAGTAFDLDSAGLVVASVEGTLNPDGVMIFLGRPDAVPPPVPVRFRTTPEVDTARTRLAGFRPRLRPSDLEERFERDNLGGLTRAELGGLRPKHRPESPQENADPDVAPTAQAVASSVAPRIRPKGFAAIVSAAVRAPATDSANVATIAPATVTPRIPSSASVARQATLKNEINLRRVNLIGVYGTPSNRRALVRLPSGRYKKVKVGDTVDGGRVVAIGDSELRYQKSGRSLTLKIPSS